MRLLVVGFDGLDYEVYKHTRLDWTPQILNSLYRMSGPCWITIYTGAPSQVHGVSNVVGMRNDGSLAWRDMKLPCVWDVLAEGAHTVALCNLPITSPPRRVNGWMVSGYPLWEKPYGKGINTPDWWFYTSDIHYHRELPNWNGGHGYGFTCNDADYYRAMTEEQVIEAGQIGAAKIMEWFVDQAQEADFGFIGITWIDRFGHHKGIKKQNVEKIAGLVDLSISWLIERLSPEKVLLLSDHGLRKRGHQEEGVIASMGIDLGGVEHIGHIADLIVGAFGLEMPKYEAEFYPDPLRQTEKKLEGWGYMS